MTRTLLLLTLILAFPLAAFSQNSKKVKALQKQKTELQSTLKKSQDELRQTQKKVKAGEKNITFIGHQLEDRLRYIRQL